MAVLLAASWGVVPLGAQAPPDSLAALISGLRLTTGSGVAEWLGRLGVATGQPVHERLLAVGTSGEILGALDGTETSVVVTPEFERDFIHEGAAILLVHNHPGGTSLSQQDLQHLESPGVAAIVAIGHDGSVYAAAKPLSFARARRCDSECYIKARDEVSKALRIELTRMATTASTAASFSTHLTMLALAKAGYYDYVAVMAPDRRLIFDRQLVAFSRVVASARAAVEK